MTKARIFQPDKTAMQSGKAKEAWHLEYAPEKPFFIYNLNGWTGMDDMKQEIKLFFPSKDAAIAYAERHGIPYEVAPPNPRRQIRKPYADNFKFSKITG